MTRVTKTVARRRWSRWFAALLITATAASGCSSPAGDDETASDTTLTSESDGAGPTTTADESPADTEGDTATGSDAGADESDADADEADEREPVVVAVLYPDLSILVDFGFADPIGDYGPPFEAFMADANERGGIAGHDIVVEMVEFDLLVAGDSTRACLTATQDLDAFIVLGTGGVFGDPVVCVAEQNETLMIQDDGSPLDFYKRSDGRLFTFVPPKDETQAAIATAFEDELRAAPFAVLAALGTGGDFEATEAGLLPALADRGLDPAMTIVLDSDQEIAASQIPIEVAALRDAGVETIIATADVVATAPFARALEAAGLDIQWLGSDSGGFASTIYASQIDPAQMDGARAVTVRTTGWENSGLDEPAADADCRARAAALLGIELPADSVDVASANYACNFADLLVAAGALVEGPLTTESMAAALRSVADIDVATYGPAGFDGTESIAKAGRIIERSSACGCWQVVSDFVPLATG